MTQLLILGRAIGEDCPRYRGTWRLTPIYCDAFPEDHPVNLSWAWMIEQEGKGGCVNDLPQAERLVRVYQEYLSEPFEVVEVVEGGAPPTLGKTLLGFDIAENFGQSLLTKGLNAVGSMDCEQCLRMQPLFTLFTQYFAPKLNSDCLFPDYDAALFCLQCMSSFHQLHPNLWDTEFHFEVVGVYSMDAKPGVD